MNSPFHIIINEIREKYGGKEVSILDIYDIETAYKLCSTTNIRNDNCAFLRITCFGLDEIVFEDIVTKVDLIQNDKKMTFDELDFEIKKVLYRQAYGVILLEVNEKMFTSEDHKPSFSFIADKEEVIRLKQKCLELENEIKRLCNKNVQQSFFDLNDTITE